MEKSTILLQLYLKYNKQTYNKTCKITKLNNIKNQIINIDFSYVIYILTMGDQTVIIILLCFVIFICYCFLLSTWGMYYYSYQSVKSETVEHFISKPYLWVYWEKPDQQERPEYISLCIDTMRKNSEKYYNMVLLDDKSVYNYLPNLRKDINKLPLALKADYIRIALLQRYGGLWLDADTIMMNDMKQVYDLLEQDYDFIGFGCTGDVCKHGHGVPSNGMMGAKKNSELMTKCLVVLNKKLDDNIEKNKEFGYFDLGKLVIWKELEDLMKNSNYKYYHFGSEYDGTRNKKGSWITPELIFEKDVDLLDENKLMIVALINSWFCGNDSKYNWFCKLKKNEIINGKYYISKLFNKALI